MYVPTDDAGVDHGEVNLGFTSDRTYSAGATGTTTNVTSQDVMQKGQIGAVNPVFQQDA
jgi:hypothetical protein